MECPPVCCDENSWFITVLYAAGTELGSAAATWPQMRLAFAPQQTKQLR